MASPTQTDTLIHRRTRIKYTRKQVDRLEAVFTENHYPDTELQENLAMELGATTDRIAIWFQNRRSRFKREGQSEQVAWMRKQIFAPSKSQSHMSIFGTPKLPALSTPCHVLSPLESHLPRADASSEIQNISSPEQSFGNPVFNHPLHQPITPTYHLATPTRPHPYMGFINTPMGHQSFPYMGIENGMPSYSTHPYQTHNPSRFKSKASKRTPLVNINTNGFHSTSEKATPTNHYARPDWLTQLQCHDDTSVTSSTQPHDNHCSKKEIEVDMSLHHEKSVKQNGRDINDDVLKQKALEYLEQWL